MADGQYVGSYTLDEVVLERPDNSGTVIITDLVKEINIQSSIIDATNIAKLLIQDGRNILSYPLVGGCTVYMSMTIDGESRQYRYKVARVNNIQDMETQKVYTVECISQLAYDSLYRKDSASYTGSVSDIAFQIYSRYSVEPYSIWDASDNVSRVIIPTWSPIVAIQWLASRSVKAETSTRMRFYQDSRGKYNFMSPEMLIASYNSGDKKPMKFVHMSNNAGTDRSGQQIPNTAAAKNSILRIAYRNSFDIAQGLREGFFSGRNYNVNITNKTIGVVDYSYFEDLKQEDRYLKKNSFYAEGEQVPGVFRVKIDGDFEDNAQNDISDIKKSSITGYNQQVTIQIRGNTSVDVGQLVDLEVPDPSPNAELDKLFTQRYYVVGKRDIYAIDGYTSTLDLAGDGTWT